MRKEFTGYKEKGGYEVYLGSSCKQHKLRPIVKKSKITSKDGKSEIRSTSRHRIQVHHPNNLYVEWHNTLKPFYDNDKGKNKFEWQELIDHQSKKFNEELFNNYCDALLEFFNKYGLYEKRIVSKLEFELHKRKGNLTYEKYKNLRDYSIKTMLNNTLTIEELYEAKAENKNAYEDLLEEILEPLESEIYYKDKEWRLRTTDTLSSIWYSFAFQTQYFKFNNCRNCGIPIIKRRGAKSCSLECKNAYHNPNRIFKKGEK